MSKNKKAPPAKITPENKDDRNIFTPLLANIEELEKAETKNTVTKIHKKINEALSNIDIQEKKLRKELTSLLYQFVAAVLAYKDGTAEGELKNLLECIIVDPFLGDHHGSALQKSPQDQSNDVALIHDALKNNLDNRDPRALLKYLRDWHNTLTDQLQKQNFDLKHSKDRSSIKEIIGKNKTVFKVRDQLHLSSAPAEKPESKSAINETAENIFYDVLERSFGAEEYDVDAAIADLEKAAKIMDENPEPSKAILHSDILFRLFCEYKNKGDHDKAFKYVQKSADLGLANASYYTGIYFLQKNNIQNAIIYFEKAAKKGDIDSNIILANIYDLGSDFSPNPSDKNTYVEKDAIKALKFFEAAKRKGDAESIYRIGIILQTKDPKRAVECFQDAASKGNSSAHFILGYKVIKIRGENATKAEVTAAIHHLEEALKSFEKETIPYFLTNFYLATLYFANHFPDKANACLEKIEGPEFQDYNNISKDSLKELYHKAAISFAKHWNDETIMKYAKKAQEYGDSSPQMELIILENNIKNIQKRIQSGTQDLELSYFYWIKKSIKFLEKNPTSNITSPSGVKMLDNKKQIIAANYAAGGKEIMDMADKVVEAENHLRDILKLPEEKAKILLAKDRIKFLDFIVLLSDKDLKVLIKDHGFEKLYTKTFHLLFETYDENSKELLKKQFSNFFQTEENKESKDENKDSSKKAVPTTPTKTTAVSIHTPTVIKDKGI